MTDGSHSTGCDVAGLDRDDGDVQVGIGAGHAALLRAPVAERDRHLVAAQHMRAGEDEAGLEHDAGPAAPAAAEPDHGRADALGRRHDRLL